MRWMIMGVLTLSAAALSAQDRSAKALYQGNCAGCHGQDGSARTPSGAKLPGRNLTEAKWQAKMTDSELEKSILNGKGGMPGYKGQLSEAEVQRLIQEVIRPMAARKK